MVDVGAAPRRRSWKILSWMMGSSMFIIHLKVINMTVTSTLYTSGDQPDDPMGKNIERF